MSTPTGKGISVDGVEKGLGNRLEKLIRALYHSQVSILSLFDISENTHKIRLPQTLTHAKQLLRRRPTDNKVLCKINAPNTIKPADKWLARLGVQPRNDGGDKPRTEAALVQGGRYKVGKGAGGDLALFAEAVHVYFVAEEVRDGGHVGGEAGEAEEDVVAVLEDFGEVVGDGEGLEAEAEVAGYGYAVFAYHCYAGAAVWEGG